MLVHCDQKEWLGSLDATQRAFIMDLSTQTFQPIQSPHPEDVLGGSLLTFHGHAYHLGGLSSPSGDPLSGPYMQIYDQITGFWYSCSSPPKHVDQAAPTPMERAGLIVTLGGREPTAILQVDGSLIEWRNTVADVFCYDRRSKSWAAPNPSESTLPGGPTYALTAAAVDDYTILTMGGKGPSQGNRAPPAAHPEPQLLDIRTWRWRPCAAPLPEGYSPARRFATAVNYQGKVLVIGGRTAEEHESKDMVCYDPRGVGSWQRMPHLPAPVTHASAVVVNVPCGSSREG
jgi:hypothetical protein